jgi:hypothetical protein
MLIRNFLALVLFCVAAALMALLHFAPLVLAATLARLALVLPRLEPAPGVVGYIRGVRLIELEPFVSVPATGKATATWEKIASSTVDRVILQLGGTALTKAMLTGIKLYVDQTLVFDDTGSRTDSRMQYRGIAANAAFLSLDFNELRARTIPQFHIGAIDMRALNAKRITAEVDITGATAPTLTPYAMVSPSPQSDAPRYNDSIAKVLSKTFDFSAAGEFPLPITYRRHPNSYLKRMHLFSAIVTALRVRKTYPDGVSDEIFKAGDALNDFIQGEFENVPQASVFTWDAVWNGDIGRALPLGNALAIEWFVTVSGAGSVPVVSELIDPLQNN